jgi:hypothetical protein
MSGRFTTHRRFFTKATISAVNRETTLFFGPILIASVDNVWCVRVGRGTLSVTDLANDVAADSNNSSEN